MEQALYPAIDRLLAKRLTPKMRIKNQVLAYGFSADVVKKGMARAERWQKAAYGEVDWTQYVSESSFEGAAQAVRGWCMEVVDGTKITENMKQFGILGSGRNR